MMKIGVIGPRGRNLEKAIRESEADACVVAVIGIHSSDGKEVSAPFHVVNLNTHRNPRKRNLARLEILERHEADVVFLDGYPPERLKPEFMDAWSGRILEYRTDLLAMGAGQESLPYAIIGGEKVIGLKMAIVCAHRDGEQLLFERSMPHIEPQSSRTFHEAAHVGSIHFKEALTAIANGEIALPTDHSRISP